MPTVTDHPSAVGTSDEWALGAGADKVVAVASNDGDTTLINLINPGAQFQQLYTMPNLPVDAYLVSAVTEHGVFRQFAGVTGACYVWINGASWQTIGAPTGSYVDYPAAWTANLTVSAVNGAESGVQNDIDAATEFRCTEVYRVTTYSTFQGGLVFLISLLAPVIGPGLMLAEMPRLAQELRRRTKYALHPHELRPAWLEWRAWRQRRYAF